MRLLRHLVPQVDALAAGNKIVDEGQVTRPYVIALPFCPDE
jgi:hypothetical protein